MVLEGPKFLALLGFLLALTGCATRPVAPEAPLSAPVFPANAFITQRAILTARGHQYALNGYLSLNETGGRRLIITENFGKVLADLLQKRDGRVYVMQSSRAFPAKWIRRYVAKDLASVLGEAPPAGSSLKMPATNHFVIETRWYSLDLRTLEIKSGPQPPELFDETRADPARHP